MKGSIIDCVEYVLFRSWCKKDNIGVEEQLTSSTVHRSCYCRTDGEVATIYSVWEGMKLNHREKLLLPLQTEKWLGYVLSGNEAVVE